jgi:hypothetical protein
MFNANEQKRKLGTFGAFAAPPTSIRKEKQNKAKKAIDFSK